MFGLLQPCRHVLDDDLLGQWRAHLCGLCLSLRDGHGQSARLTTNTDTVMVSVLTAAQRVPTAQTRAAGPCALRGMRGAQVVVAEEPGIALATATSLTLAAAKARDVLAEHRHGLGEPGPIRRVAAATAARSLQRRVERIDGGLDTRSVLAVLDAQAGLEAADTDLDALTRPTADACAEVFAATADLADAPANRDALADIGAEFGRIAHLLDAVDDRDEDARAGAFNPLAATGTDDHRALAIAGMSADRIADRYRELAVHDDRLLRVLLVDGVARAVRHRRTSVEHRAIASFAEDRGYHGAWPQQAPHDWPERWPYPPPFPPNRRWHRRVLPFLGVSCCGPAMCTDHWNHCSDRYHSANCDPDCSGCDCCTCDC